MRSSLPYAVTGDGIRLTVRLVPKSSADRIIGLAADAEGAAALKIAVTAPPEAGKANHALLRLLSRLLKIPQRDLTLVLGAADRRKLVHVAGDPAALTPRFEKVLHPWLKPG